MNFKEINFLTENGAIVDENYNLYMYIPGTPEWVNFPWEYIEELHNRIPGQFRMIHTHPIGMHKFSNIDLVKCLVPWALSMHPFPARLSVITYKSDILVQYDYVAFMKPKGVWALDKTQPRVHVETERYDYVENDKRPNWYFDKLIKESYGNTQY